MPIANYRAIVTGVEKLTGKVIRANFRCVEPTSIQISAGQYVNIRVAERARRSYSLSSLPGEVTDLETYVDIEPGGPGSKFFAELKVGQEFKFIGPLGNFVYSINIDPTAPAIFLATGTGITPFISMLNAQLAGETRQFRLYWGLRYEEDIFWRAELDELAKRYPQFSYELCLSQSDEGWQGRRGYCTDALMADWQGIPAIDSAQFYLCGGSKMLDAGKLMLAEAGIQPAQVIYEKFY